MQVALELLTMLYHLSGPLFPVRWSMQGYRKQIILWAYRLFSLGSRHNRNTDKVTKHHHSVATA